MNNNAVAPYIRRLGFGSSLSRFITYKKLEYADGKWKSRKEKSQDMMVGWAQ